MRKLGTFKLLGYTWTEYTDDKLCEAHNAFGYTDMENCEIVYQETMEETRGTDVVLHERIHAVNEMIQAGLTHKQVYAIARGLAQLGQTYKAAKKPRKARR